jgi:hypothetical protein
LANATPGTSRKSKRYFGHGGINMAEKFNPAPHDKHADDPREAALADQEMHARLEADLIDSFPASDPVSATQPSLSNTASPSLSPSNAEHDEEGEKRPSLWDRLLSVFR